MEPVDHPVRPEEEEGRQEQQADLEPGAACTEPAHRGCREKKRCDRRADGHHHDLPPRADADQQDLRVEDEDERQDRGPKAVPGRLQAGGVRVVARYRRRRIGSQADRRRHVGHDAEIEHEEVHRDQRDHEVAARAEFDDDRRHERGDQDVVGGGRHAGADQQADHRGQHEHDEDVAGRNLLDEVGHHEPHAGQRDHADDESCARARHADADHAASAEHQRLPKVFEALAPPRRDLPRATQVRQHRRLDDDQYDGRRRRPESRGAGRKLLDHQAPEQDDDRDEEVRTRAHRRPGLGQVQDRRERIVLRDVREARRIREQADIDNQREDGKRPRGALPEDPAHGGDAVVDERQGREGAADAQRPAQDPLFRGSHVAARNRLEVVLERL